MKKIISLISFILLLVSLSNSKTLSKSFYVDTNENIMLSQYNISDSVLISYTTAAFTIYNSSTQADSWEFHVFPSSIEAQEYNTDGSTVTITFLTSASTSQLTGGLLNEINKRTNWHATLCDGAWVGAETSTPNASGDGVAEGLSFNSSTNGKSYTSSSFVSSTAVTVYYSATDRLAVYFDENNDTYCVDAIYSTSTATGKKQTIYLYEGTDISTNTTTLIAIPQTDGVEIYPTESPVKTTSDYSLGCVVEYGTWTASGDRIQIHKHTQE